MNIKKICSIFFILGNKKYNECTDTNKYCEDWSRIGECHINKEYMLNNCKKSCNSCNYIDHNILCYYWSSIGECEKNFNYMNKYCKNNC